MSVLAAARKGVQDALAGLSVPVYAHPPQDFKPPFVTIDRALLNPDDNIAEKISRVRVTFSVFSEARGARQVEEVLDEIYARLHDVDLALDDGTTVMSKIEFLDAVRDQDGVTYVGSGIVAVTVWH